MRKAQEDQLKEMRAMTTQIAILSNQLGKYMEILADIKTAVGSSARSLRPDNLISVSAKVIRGYTNGWLEFLVQYPQETKAELIQAHNGTFQIMGSETVLCSPLLIFILTALGVTPDTSRSERHAD